MPMPNYIVYLCASLIKPLLYNLRFAVCNPAHRIRAYVYMRISQIRVGNTMTYAEWTERRKWIEAAYLKRTKGNN